MLDEEFYVYEWKRWLFELMRMKEQELEALKKAKR